jgi:xanthine dehydrogenase accessory factor
MVFEVLQELLREIEKGRSVALATIVAVNGASPAQAGFELLVAADGSVTGNVGGGELEVRIRQEAQAAIADGKARMVTFALREEGPDAIGMLCGGQVTAFIDPYTPKPKLLIIGGGHIGHPLAEMARIVGYDVQVIDVRPERSTEETVGLMDIPAHSYVVLVTENHISDEKFLRIMLDTSVPYVGMIGSRRKAGIIFDHLRSSGYSDAQLARVHAPIGLDLGGRLPSEIALAILAEVEAIRHGGSGQPRSCKDNASIPEVYPMMIGSARNSQ